MILTAVEWNWRRMKRKSGEDIGYYLKLLSWQEIYLL
jgi:hypothetical protein